MPDRSMSAVPVSSQNDRGRPLVVDVAVPVALGLLVLVATLGFAAAVAAKTGLPLLPVTLGAGLVLTGALGAWVAWVLRDAALAPLGHFHASLRQLEEGDFEARVEPAGAAEFRELAGEFNRTVAILGHQRERLKALAGSDALTGLANHRTLQQELRAAVDGETPVGIVTLDIDGFKRVNEELGQAGGDETLKAVAQAVAGAARETDLAARLGGDDFALLLRDCDPPRARELAERARDAVARVLPEELHLACAAGYACAPSQLEPGEDLLELALTALRSAKSAGGARTERYDPEAAERVPSLRQNRVEVETLLASREPVRPVFQPIVELATGRVVGYEALARFPQGGGRTPDLWFDQATRVGLGLKLETASVEAALLARDRPAGTYLSLNLSPAAIASDAVRRALPYGLSDVVIELTEHDLAPEDGALEAGLTDLRSRGARIAVDDASAGYAGLQQVTRVQPDIIKLDRGIVSHVDTDSARAALIEFFVVFARRIGAQVVCEGIETAAELATLARLGVALGQGYLLGRPAEPWAELADDAMAAVAAVQGPLARPAPVNRRLARR
jgi:diguanylate cyclase (GGDEF)-like protein